MSWSAIAAPHGVDLPWPVPCWSRWRDRAELRRDAPSGGTSPTSADCTRVSCSLRPRLDRSSASPVYLEGCGHRSLDDITVCAPASVSSIDYVGVSRAAGLETTISLPWPSSGGRLRRPAFRLPLGSAPTARLPSPRVFRPNSSSCWSRPRVLPCSIWRHGSCQAAGCSVPDHRRQIRTPLSPLFTQPTSPPPSCRPHQRLEPLTEDSDAPSAPRHGPSGRGAWPTRSAIRSRPSASPAAARTTIRRSRARRPPRRRRGDRRMRKNRGRRMAESFGAELCAWPTAAAPRRTGMPLPGRRALYGESPVRSISSSTRLAPVAGD